MLELKEVRGALLGEACGDALGYPLIHLSQEKILSIFGQFGLRLLVRTRKSIGKSAPVTELTQLMLSTVDGLLWSDAKKIDVTEGVYKGYMRWYYGQTGEEPRRGQKSWMRRQSHEHEICLIHKKFMHERREGDEDCLNALSSVKRGTKKHKLNDSESSSVLTRAIPVGLLYSDDFKLAFEKAVEIAYLTHSSDIAVLSAGTLAALVSLSVSGSSIPKALETIYEFLNKVDNSDSIISLLSAAQEQSVKHPAGKGGSWDYIDSINSLGSGEKANEALAMAVFCFMTIDDPFEAVIAAANHGGNSSAVASITGALEGIRHGEKFLPNYWTDMLEGRENVELLAEKFCHMCEKRILRK